ncbi:MAG TPA: alpha/beta hydrolase [Dehalococcoidia bacterium]|nr:alpha/beta hydrolase [Dehalococcoidia bacterium]
MIERTISVRGGAFQTEVFEAGTGPPLLYLHGVGYLPADDPFLQLLATTHHIIAPHMPGFGNSTGSEHLFDIHDLIYYELDLLDTLGLYGLPVAGHSLGAMVAAELAAVQPERFTALVMIAPLGLWNPEYPVADFFSMSPTEVARATYYNAESPTARAAAAPARDDEGYIAFMLDRAKSLATAAKYLWPIPNRGLAGRLHRVAAPTLLVWGESDGIVPPQYAQEFQRLIPQARLETIAEARHLPQVEQPERLAQAVLEFLR